jgi:hypothetical protein
MSDTEAQNKTEDVNMDAPATTSQDETTKTAKETTDEVTTTADDQEEAAPAAESSTTEDKKTNEEPAADADMEAEANGEAAEGEDSKTDGAPVSKKPKSKASGSTSRRNGVPKNNTSETNNNTHYKPGDVVLARVKGYPMWRMYSLPHRAITFAKLNSASCLSQLLW